MGKKINFSGLLANATQATIPLHGGDAETGYRVKDFRIMPEKPLTNSNESLLQIWKTKQDAGALSTDVNFDDPEFLGMAIWSNNATTENYPEDLTVFFDDEVVNQDLYVTCFETSGRSMNFMLTLEEVKMPKGEQAVVNFNAALLHVE